MELDNVVEVCTHQIGHQVAAEAAENTALDRRNSVHNLMGQKTHSSLNSSSAAEGVKTSRSPMTCGDGGINNSIGRLIAELSAGCMSAYCHSLGTNILVFHVLEQPEFPVGATTVDEGLKRPGKLLYCHLLPHDNVIG